MVLGQYIDLDISEPSDPKSLATRKKNLERYSAGMENSPSSVFATEVPAGTEIACS